MPLRPALLTEIQAALAPATIPSLTSASDASDLYEAYLFSLVCRAAQDEGGTVVFRSISNQASSPAVFVFRTSPGLISSTARDYGYAVIKFDNQPPLEAHVGVRIAGASQVLHECDIVVLLESEANLCRCSSARIAPRSSKTIVSIEAKFYSTSLALGLGRAFLGFTLDVSSDKSFFVINREAPSIEKLLARKKRLWEHRVQPANSHEEGRLRAAFQTAFRDYKACY